MNGTRSRENQPIYFDDKDPQPLAISPSKDYNLLIQLTEGSDKTFRHIVQHFDSEGRLINAYVYHKPGHVGLVITSKQGAASLRASEENGGLASFIDFMRFQESYYESPFNRKLIFLLGETIKYELEGDKHRYVERKPLFCETEWFDASVYYTPTKKALEHIGWNDEEKPFEGTKVYFSNSIKGQMGDSEDIGISLVQYMSEKGADVLSENVAFLKPEESLPIFERRAGIDLSEIENPLERAQAIREVDINWVDEADVLVAVVNGASYGVGMEIQRALDWSRFDNSRKPKPILCLVHQESFRKLSNMIIGIDNEKEKTDFTLATYKTLDEAVSWLNSFLSLKMAPRE